MLLLDITVVNVALPDIQRSLHSSFADLQWVVDAYALTLATFLLTSGSIADLIGRRRVFIAGLFGAVTGAAVAVGPVLGGIITSGLGWEWIFFVNVPIGIAAVIIAFTKVADSRDPNATGVDWAGLVTFSGALFLLVYALVQGNEKGWRSTEIVTLLVLAVALLVAFVLVEHLQSRPMLDLALFRRPAFTGASIVAFTLSSSFFAMFLYLTLYIQDVLGYSPFQAGLRF